MDRVSLINTSIQPDSKPPVSWKTANPSADGFTYTHWLSSLADGFLPINLRQMDRAALQDRTDIKYILTIGQLLTALARLQPHYQILSVHGQRLNHYRTLYFDTPDFMFYRMHINDRAERYKVRTREYTDSNQSFLEIKHKTRKDRTIKDRLSTDEPVTRITQSMLEWLGEHIPCDSRSLEPKLWNTFTRLTLVNKHCCERVTIDVDLAFSTAARSIHLDGLAVVEVKMDSPHQFSPFMKQMREQRVQPNGFSKYCIGVSMLYDRVKKNALKPKLLWIRKISEGAVNYE